MTTLSVCVPNYNHARFLGDALTSVFVQDFQPSEILILDDASTDDSWEVIERLTGGRRNVRLLRNTTNGGVVPALNRLLHEATAEYIHFVAADDFLLPGFYAKAMRLLSAHPSAGLCASKTYQLMGGTQMTLPVLDTAWGFSPQYLAPGGMTPPNGYIYGNTVVIKREALIAAGGYRAELRWYSDWFANCIVALRHGMCFEPDPLAVCRVVDEQYSGAQSNWDEKSAVLRTMLRTLKLPEYADVREAFGRSGILGVFGVTGIARIVLETPDLLDEETRRLVLRLLEPEPTTAGTARTSASPSQYSPAYLRPRVAELVGAWRERNARVVIFGAGEHTANLFKWTELLRANITAIVDSNPQLAGEVYWGVPLSAPASLPELDADVVLISSMFAQDQMADIVRRLRPGVEIVRLYDNAASAREASARG